MQLSLIRVLSKQDGAEVYHDRLNEQQIHPTNNQDWFEKVVL